MRLLILYDRNGWAYERRAKALLKHTQKGWNTTIAFSGTPFCSTLLPVASGRRQFDAVFLLDYAMAATVRERMRNQNWGCPLIVSFNTGPMRRRGMWQQVYDAADFVICNSQATYESWSKHPRRCCISNGVDLDTFTVKTPLAERGEKCLWYGRAGKARKGLRAVLRPLAKLLGEHGFTFDFRELPAGEPPMTTPELVEWYNRGAYVLCASEPGYEGTPNLVTEAVACGCVAVTTPTGNVLEWGRDGENCLLADQNPVSFLDKLFEARRRRLQLAKAGVAALQSWGWSERAPHFYRLFGRIVKQGAVGPFSYMDE